MILIVDTNVIISAALRQSITQDLIFNLAFQLYTPEFVGDEIEKHKRDILNKSGYTEERFNSILSLIFSRITIIPEDEYLSHKNEVLKFTPDKKDWPFLALAKHLDAALWSYGSDLKKKQSVIKVFTTSDLIKLLEE